jgi:L,D-peptidoglycan transpeptidase YkuD (ErfK/YbiS/YcfS/YnhG family)
MKLTMMVAALVACSAMQVRAGACPEPLGGAQRLVLVTTPSMGTALARVGLFTRAARTMPWQKVGETERAVVGKAGLGWGHSFGYAKRSGEPSKIEGDRRTPAGFFRLGPSFGFETAGLPGHIVLKGRETVCVEDPASPFYNTISTRSEIGFDVRADDMRSNPLYRRGLFVQYPTDRANRRGSCILVHIWQSPATGTAGCVGLPESRVAALQEFARSGAVLAVLPEGALDRFPGCLPDVAHTRGRTP